MQDRIEQVAKEELAKAKAARREAGKNSGRSDEPVTDYYQMSTNDAQMASQRPATYGSPAEMNQVVDDMVKETTEKYYNAYRNQYDHLVDANDPNGAQRTANEYMMQFALPMVASLVEMYGPEAIMNNKNALSKLDGIMLTGNGAGDGYTRAYIKQMYSQVMGKQGSSSDAEVIRGIQRATSIADQGDVRGAVGMARELKNRIDNGELSANEEDYNTLLRAAETR